ncbi:MAG TPA: sterol desaturase family protein [Crenotrichaceae bacterium]|nr:sterol desaturase family protein [Crenotrichaceae bacterium]
MFDELLARNDEIEFIAVFGGMAFLFLIEAGVPRRIAENSQTQRWLNNISLALLNYYLTAMLSFQFAVIALYFQPEMPFLKHVELPVAVTVLLTILVADGVNYWLHRAFHQFPILWRVHVVHHTDTEFDVTTANRHHPLELMITMLVTLPVAVFLGAPIIAVIIYTYLSILVNLLSHANISLPNWLDRVLRLLIVTPDFHRMHHSSYHQYTESNYGTISPWFDYLFGTATGLAYDQLPNMQLGLDRYRRKVDGRLDRLLTLPFTYRR